MGKAKPTGLDDGRASRLSGAALLAAVVAVALFLVSGSAGAQSANEPYQVAQNDNRSVNPFRPLLRWFGGGQKRQKKPERRSAPRRTAPPAGTPPAFVEEPKDPNAGLILVVGDRMARGVADGLRFTLSDQPMIRVETITEDRLGLAGQDAPDWNARVLARIRGADVKAVVVMLGRRDLGKTFAGEPPVEFMTDAWRAAYREKVEGLVRTVRRERKPIVWVGLPPTGAALTNTDFTALNDIFRAATEERRARFVDIWDIFLSEDEKYTSFGPDVEGKNRRLRSSNRIGFTWSGFRKVAFFVERELSRLLGGYGGLAFEGVEDDPNFIVLTGRTTSPEVELLGGDARVEEPDTASPTYRFLVIGEDLPPVPGRVDDTRVGTPAVSALEMTAEGGR
ncbi:MAG: DUF459 domain-containing protein [Roseibium sp.]|nr:DUF459 domain-containing protein [Roseibium sp.]